MFGLRKEDKTAEVFAELERKRKEAEERRRIAELKRFQKWERYLWRVCLKARFPAAVYAVIWSVAISPKETRPWDLRRSCEHWLETCYSYIGRDGEWHMNPKALGQYLTKLKLKKDEIIGGGGRHVLYIVDTTRARKMMEVLSQSQRLHWLFREFWDKFDQAKFEVSVVDWWHRSIQKKFLECLTCRRVQPISGGGVRFEEWLWEKKDKP